MLTAMLLYRLLGVAMAFGLSMCASAVVMWATLSLLAWAS